MEEEKKSSPYLLPVSILVAGVLIAGSVIYSVGADNTGANIGEQVPSDLPSGDLDSLKAITKDDHLKGDLDAPVKIVEFSDMECPFCNRVHPTLQQLVKDYNGQVAWVYRHFPLEQLHPNAPKDAETAECVAEQGGNEMFWTFLDKWNELVATDGPSPELLAQATKDAGADTAKLDNCVKSGKYKAVVDANSQDAMATGGQGTPWNIVIGPDGAKAPVSGAQPVSAFKQVIDQMLN